MRRFTKFLAAASLVPILAMTVFSSIANAQFGSKMVKVTVTNISNQVLSPVVVAAHSSGASIFKVGEMASPELAGLAEDAVFMPLVGALESTDGVGDVGVITGAGGPIVPGESASIDIEAFGLARRISAVSMLVSTNDAFAGLNSVRAPNTGIGTHMVVAYDAGSEANTESCDHIPGPPCGMPLVTPPDMPEGYIYVHPGIRGDGGVPLTRDWRNPVAQFTIERLR